MHWETPVTDTRLWNDFFFWCQISHLCGSNGSEERCQFGVKGRALQLLKEPFL